MGTGYRVLLAAMTAGANALGRVVRVDAKVVHVDVDAETVTAGASAVRETPAGEPILAALRGALFEDLQGQKNPVAVGDRVRFLGTGGAIGSGVFSLRDWGLFFTR